ncbi:MAG TPA: GC-type dockerin domain-anchored protein, partial [Phycisphaerales bacterium]|nr:GC-type dockerin domain-anchored protein [Phycisphaerales bacterium]
DGWGSDLVTGGSGTLGGLIAVGNFVRAADSPAAGVAAFDGRAWSALGTADVGNGAPDARAIIAVDAGMGTLGGRMYVASRAAGGAPTHGVAAWDGDAWSSIGPASMETVHVQCFALGDLGGGARLFAGGHITPDAAGTDAIIAWDGEAWSVVAGGLDSASINAMAVGSVAGGESMLFVGGHLNAIGGEEFHAVAAIDDQGWVHLGGGLPGQNGRNDRVLALALHDDGAGSALYAGGLLDDQVPALANGVVKWEGVAWSRLGDPLDAPYAAVYALCSADLGNGPRLYAAGEFDGGSGAPRNIAEWDGDAWRPLADGLPHAVRALAVIETAHGTRLAAATGGFAGDEPDERVHLWDGSGWSEFGATANGPAAGIAQGAHEDGAVYIVGAFTEVGGVPSEGIARWGCLEGCAADFNGDNVVDSRDFIAYLDVWATGHPDADMDGNGLVDSRDFIAFLNAWSAGC